jgi:hypothetical protein
MGRFRGLEESRIGDFGLAFLALAWYNSVRFVRKGAFSAKIPERRKER